MFVHQAVTHLNVAVARARCLYTVLTNEARQAHRHRRDVVRPHQRHAPVRHRHAVERHLDAQLRRAVCLPELRQSDLKPLAAGHRKRRALRRLARQRQRLPELRRPRVGQQLRGVHHKEFGRAVRARAQRHLCPRRARRHLDEVAVLYAWLEAHGVERDGEPARVRL